MKFDPFKFAVIFWSVFILVITAHCYTRYTKLVKHFSFISGKVVDQIPKRMRKRGIVMRPQIEYVIDDSARYFVDEKEVLKTGETPVLIYQTSNPHNIQVYSFWMWIHWGAIIPSFLISLLVFRVVVILVSKASSKPEILPSNF